MEFYDLKNQNASILNKFKNNKNNMDSNGKFIDLEYLRFLEENFISSRQYIINLNLEKVKLNTLKIKLLKI